MARAHSFDLRQRVIGAIDAGMSRRAAAERFGVAPSAAIKWYDRWHRTGTLAPHPQGGDKRSERIEALADAILALVAAAPGITLAEIARHLARSHGQRFAPSVIHRFLARRGLTKRSRRRAGAPERRDP